MAIAGSPGIPSLGLYLYNGEVRQTPIIQNKPAMCVEQDLERAVSRILAGEIVQVDARGGNVGRVTRRLKELWALNISSSN